MKPKIPASPLNSIGSVLCPDQQGTCPDGSTCCKLASGKYGCCPLAKATCCSDHVHCCPHGYTCDTATSQCSKGDISIPMKRKLPAVPVTWLKSVKSVVCPDQQSYCPDGSTCCKLASGKYGCCPLVKAVCCSDHQHCCPHGYTCDTASSKCNKGDISVPMKPKIPASPLNSIGSVLCPDQQGTCPDGSTCCKLASGKYGCCPLAKATCCSDHVHCCPHGYTCDVATSQCSKGDISIPMRRKMPAVPVTWLKSVKSVVCPDQQSYCPDGSTCCLLPNGKYGCCPLVKAVCCSDHQHCCPHGYTCDTASSKCNKGDISVPMEPKIPALPLKSIGSVICPDQQGTCPDGSTCCKLASGKYGCCPLAKATCCSDHVHCCPHGYTCDTATSRCNKGGISIPMKRKMPAVPVTWLKSVKSVICPDQQSYCPDGSTCCLLASGKYGCCPLVKAVCCSDHQHCCPHGYTCDTASSKCNKGDISVPMELKIPASPLKSIGSVICPDQQGTCPDGSTCCKLASGKYGCCPLAKATCCSDHQHCCPHGYTCDVTTTQCRKGDMVVPMSRKVAAWYAAKKSTLCADKKTECPSDYTCCQMAGGGYACCPLTEAVCCKDHVHCCPKGYTCDLAKSTCAQGSLTTPLVKKVKGQEVSKKHTKLVEAPGVGVVNCPDGQSYCQDNSTCCLLLSGQYGCCPLPKATCCSDHLHCCPHGSTCDTAAQTCNKGQVSIPWTKKVAANRRVTGTKHDCPGGAWTCPDSATCCKLPSGHWACCPEKEAVCCKDHIHCCAKGQTCTSTSCVGALANSPLLKKIPAEPVKTNAVVCPDKKSECPDNSTCCLLASGKYGCCPLPKATCCKDHQHCCPHKYKCDTAAGKCNPRVPQIAISWASLKRSQLATSALLKKETPVVECPDKKSQCPQDNTCCLLRTGSYGCCLMAKAVCCSDKIHCCPSGSQCNNGTCKKDGVEITWMHFSRYRAKPRQAMEKATVKHVECPDHKSMCPGDQTCCQRPNGGYACCPYKQAVCCSDHLHCCPSGMTCDVKQGMCQQGKTTIPWLHKVEARPIGSGVQKVEEAAVMCPDGRHECPNGQTCCKLSSGQWGCCPLPQATCCSDGRHCCPHGYKCDAKKGSCLRRDQTASIAAAFLSRAAKRGHISN